MSTTLKGESLLCSLYPRAWWVAFWGGNVFAAREGCRECLAQGPEMGEGF